MAASGQLLSFLVVQFRILIDDVGETRFSDVQIAALFNVAELDVINDVRIHGWNHKLEKTSETDPKTILANTQEVTLGLSNLALLDVPYIVKRAETNDTSIIPIFTQEAALKSQQPVVYFRYTADSTPITYLGYYRKVSSDMKFTIQYYVDIVVDFNQSTYAGTDTTEFVPKAFNNLLLYKALALASSSDNNRASTFDARYAQTLSSIIQVLGPKLTEVVDVYGDN